MIILPTPTTEAQVTLESILYSPDSNISAARCIIAFAVVSVIRSDPVAQLAKKRSANWEVVPSIPLEGNTWVDFSPVLQLS